MIEKMRHFLVHDYFRINIEILWTVIKEDIPLLKEQVVKYINELGWFVFVPLQNFIKLWKDEELYKKYKLSEDEIAFIKSMIKPME